MPDRAEEHTPPPDGGRAAERLRQFAEARLPRPDAAVDAGADAPVAHAPTRAGHAANLTPDELAGSEPAADSDKV